MKIDAPDTPPNLKPYVGTYVNRSFQLVDVFSEHPFMGNPLAVVLGHSELDPTTMQSITRWMNLSETAFVLPPNDPRADYRVRIFTLDREMPFAGHPTLGSCHAWLSSGGTPQSPNLVVQECGLGLVPIRRIEGRYSFQAPPLIRGGPVDAEKVEELAAFLGVHPSDIVDSTWADNGPGWIAVMLESAEAVLQLSPERTSTTRWDVGVVGAYPTAHPAAFELRAFFTDHRGEVREDPVTGSLNASIGQWLFRTGRAQGTYIASQGTRLARQGRVHVTEDETGNIWVGGAAVTRFRGHYVPPDHAR